MDRIIKQSFSVNLRIMRVLRLYPPENSTLTYKVQAYILYFVFIVVNSLLGLLYYLLKKDIDIMEISESALITCQTTCFVGKVLPFVKNGDRLRRCINYFENPRFTTQNEEQKKIIAECVGNCRRNCLFYTTGIICGLINLTTKPILLGGNRLPFQVWLPFNPTAEPKIYWTVYLYLATGVAYITFAGTLIDPLIGGLAYQAACQVKVLKDNLQHLHEHTQEQVCKNCGARKSEIMYGKIKQCVTHYSAVLSFVQEFEECLSWSVFSQFAASALSIGFCCLQLSMMETYDFYSVVTVSFIALLMTQIYFYCYYGTLMFEEGNSLTNAIYMGQWYRYDVKSRKALIMIMERAKKPMIVTAGKFVDMSIDTWTVVLDANFIIRRSFSLLAVLKSFQ